jgi:hypothetical protein
LIASSPKRAAALSCFSNIKYFFGARHVHHGSP